MIHMMQGKERKFEYNGQKYDIYELAAVSGVKVNTLRHRIFILKIPIEQAVKKKRRIEKIYTYKGESLTAAEWAKRIGITAIAFRARLKRHNYNIESALKRRYERTGSKKKQPCNMDCFNCKFADCINTNSPTMEETQMLKNAEVHLV